MKYSVPVAGLALALSTVALPAAQTLTAIYPYTAVVDRLPRAKPALPTLGAAGTAINDPAFQSRIYRVTDANTRPGAPGRSYRSPSSPHQNAWSAAGTYFWVTSGDGSIIPFKFDATNGTAQRVQPTTTGDGGLVLRFYIEPEFSHITDSLIYGSLSGSTLRTIDQYDFSSGQYSRLLDLDAIVPACRARTSAASPRAPAASSASWPSSGVRCRTSTTMSCSSTKPTLQTESCWTRQRTP